MQRQGPARVMRRTRTRAAAIGAVGAALVLGACTTSTPGNSTGPSSQSRTSGVAAPSSAPPAAPAGPAAISASPAFGSHAIDPSRAFTVSIARGRLTSVVMRNAAGKQVSGVIAAGATAWRTTEALGYGKTYHVTARGQGTDGRAVTRTDRISTLSPNTTTGVSLQDIYGTALTNHATYGVGMVVRAHFDEPVVESQAERTLDVATTPSTTGGWYWDDDQDAYWRPEHYYAPGTQVHVAAQVYGQRLGHHSYGRSDESTSFRIGPEHVSVANAKKHHVKVFFAGKMVRKMPTSMGQGGVVQGKTGPIYLWTMPGTYTVINFENPAIMSSDSFGLPAHSPLGYAPEAVPWSTKISVDGIYLHELDTTIWAQGHTNVSHGCLNLDHANAKWFYKHSRIGDVVKVIHSGGPRIQVWQGGEWSVPWSQWLKGSALS